MHLIHALPAFLWAQSYFRKQSEQPWKGNWPKLIVMDWFLLLNLYCVCLSWCKRVLMGKKSPNSENRLWLLFTMPGKDAFLKIFLSMIMQKLAVNVTKICMYSFIVFIEKSHNENILVTQQFCFLFWTLYLISTCYRWALRRCGQVQNTFLIVQFFPLYLL